MAHRLAERSDLESPLKPPTRINTLLELSAPVDALSLLWRAPALIGAPRGDGRPLLLLPGFRADRYSMWPLKGFLKKLGYRVYDWEIGRNDGDVDGMVEAVAPQVETLAARCGEPITLIAWSLGGAVARELARLYPEVVREVITFGSPISGGPKYTAVAERFAESRTLDLDAFEQDVLARNKIGFSQPVTSIYSKSDGVVGWSASVDRYNDQARNIVVDGKHFGLGVNASVWRAIADTLARSD